MIAPSTDREPVLDLSFPLTGLHLPADHGYLLYAALTTAEPELHHRVDYGVHPIAGLPLPGRRLQLTPRSRLVVRTPAGLLGLLVRLGGRTLLVGEDRVTLGAPQIRTLRPAPVLRSRLVVIRGFTEPEPFLEAARRQVEALGCRGELELAQPQRSVRLEGRTPGRPGPVRRTLRNPPLRPRPSVHGADSRAAAAGGRAGAVDGLGRRCRRQRRGRGLLRGAGGRAGDLRRHRGLLQPTATPHWARVPVAGRVRAGCRGVGGASGGRPWRRGASHRRAPAVHGGGGVRGQVGLSSPWDRCDARQSRASRPNCPLSTEPGDPHAQRGRPRR